MVRPVISFFLSFLLAFIDFIPPHLSCAQNREKYNIAVLDFDAQGLSQTEVVTLSNNMRVQVIRAINSEKFKKSADIIYNVVERSQMDKIFEQFEIQNTGCIDVSCAVEFGKMLSVERIIIGSVGLIGETYTINASIVDVETARILNVADYRLKGARDRLLDKGIPNIVNELLGIKKSRKKLYIIAGVMVAVITAAVILLWPQDEDDTAVISINIPVPSD